mmetsp:Transcript_29640/g.43938  ORF Transcript_29640/g.43938 Transcript_29640/m.43938 type:complete len:680 (+) Transcript_29640:38-2077(+)
MRTNATARNTTTIHSIRAIIVPSLLWITLGLFASSDTSSIFLSKGILLVSATSSTFRSNHGKNMHESRNIVGAGSNTIIHHRSKVQQNRRKIGPTAGSRSNPLASFSKKRDDDGRVVALSGYKSARMMTSNDDCGRSSNSKTDHGRHDDNGASVSKIRNLCLLKGGSQETTPVDSTPASAVAVVENKDDAASASKFRQAVFPIYGKHEVSKFLLLGSMKFFIVVVLVLTRDTKDTLVVTQCGAEAIAFLKIYGVLPAATAFIALYSKMASVLDSKHLFYTTCVPFFLFFLLFGTVIYPNASKLEPTTATVQSLLGASQGGTAVVAKILTHWTSALFYVVAEIYSSVSIGVLFWQFANDVISVTQAKRFYPLFAQMSGFAPILAGQYVVRYASRAENMGSSLHRLTFLISLSGVMICTLYHFATAYIERTESSVVDGDELDKQKTKKKKPKLSMMESAKFLASSQYLRLIATLVLGYGLTINFTEIMWKSMVKKQYPEALDYQRFMGNFSSCLGISTCIVIFLGVHVIRVLGWKAGALATPGLMSVLALPFFACILMGLEDNPGRLRLAVILGTVQSLLSKTGKYAMFDPTTQMAYIPLDQESKVKGKAAIDVLGSRIGKSGGSLIQQGLVFMFGNIISAAPVVVVIFYSVLFSWMASASQLSRLFTAKTAMAEKGKSTK